VTEPAALVPLVDLLPSMPPRWIFRQCRTGKIRGAVKVGRAWLISVEAFKAWAASQGATGGAATSAVDELRAAGFIPTGRGS
jgi:hypothetical protein